MTQTNTEERAKRNELLHILWTKAVGTKDYNKKEWQEFAAMLEFSSTGEKEVTADAFIQKQLDRVWEKLKDAQIERFIKPMFSSLEAASIDYFLQKGEVNGSFRIALNKMMDALRGWNKNAPLPESPDKTR
jgi:hypothetical protein